MEGLTCPATSRPEAEVLSPIRIQVLGLGAGLFLPPLAGNPPALARLRLQLLPPACGLQFKTTKASRGFV